MASNSGGPEDWLDDVTDAEDAAMDAFLSELRDEPPPPVRYASLVDGGSQAARDRALDRRNLGADRSLRPTSKAVRSSGRRGRRRAGGAFDGSPQRRTPVPVAPSRLREPIYDAPDGDGIERSSFGGQLTTLVPTKVMAFIDGSWLYYTLFERGRRCPIVQRYGAGWYHSHHVDWTAIPQLISDHVSAELLRMQQRDRVGKGGLQPRAWTAPRPPPPPSIT